MLATVKPNRAY